MTMFEYKEVRPDFALAYSALARRVAEAHAFAVAQDFAECKDVLTEAMAVMKQVETTYVVCRGPASSDNNQTQP